MMTLRLVVIVSAFAFTQVVWFMLDEMQHRGQTSRRAVKITSSLITLATALLTSTILGAL
jgi:amino acid permease